MHISYIGANGRSKEAQKAANATENRQAAAERKERAETAKKEKQSVANPRRQSTALKALGGGAGKKRYLSIQEKKRTTSKIKTFYYT